MVLAFQFFFFSNFCGLAMHKAHTPPHAVGNGLQDCCKLITARYTFDQRVKGFDYMAN